MALSRRRFLTLVGGLGASASILGCQRNQRPPLAGGIVGGNHQRGHRLRSSIDSKAARHERTTVAIIGGGIAGLTAAWVLERSGIEDYVVLELEDAPGGTARSGQNQITKYPWGAHYVPAPLASNPSLEQLLDEVGAIRGRDVDGRPRWAEGVVLREPAERLFYRGEWHEGLLPLRGIDEAERSQFRRFETLMRAYSARRDPAGRRAFAVPRGRGGDPGDLRSLDAINMSEFLSRAGLDSRRLAWYVDYACRDDFGTTPAQTSAWAGVHYFAARHEGDSNAPYLTWPEGNGRLANHLASVAAARLRLGSMVFHIEPQPDAVVVSYLDPTDTPVNLIADRAIFALPRFLLPRLYAPWHAQAPKSIQSFQYVPWLVANLELSDRPRSRGATLSWDNVPYDGTGLGYVVATHQTGSDHGPTVFTYYRPLVDDDPKLARTRLLETSWDDWAAAILAELAPAHPDLRELVTRVDLYRWGHAMIRPSPGFLWSADLLDAARPLDRLHFAHTDLSGIALFEEAQDHGVRAAREVLAKLGKKAVEWAEG